MLAFERAQAGRLVLLQEKTSETWLPSSARPGYHLAAAIRYYDINLALKKPGAGRPGAKNLAYQRIKFDATQDKGTTNWPCWSRKNQNLRMEKR